MRDTRIRADEYLRKAFKPEFLNRVDEIIHFNPLGRSEARAIAKLELAHLAKRLGESGYTVAFSDKVAEKVVDEGFSASYGARNIKRTISRMVEDPMSELVLEGKLHPHEPLQVFTIEDDGTIAVEFDAARLHVADFKDETPDETPPDET